LQLHALGILPGGSSAAAESAGGAALLLQVGDSCAWLDTGAEVLPVSGNHRLDDSAEERERITRAGGGRRLGRLGGRGVWGGVGG
jgi:serine/threonine protein phosphatase PrpC